MFVSSSAVIKLGCMIHSLAKESPLKKTSKNELDAAIREITNLEHELHKRECLNRVLCHLESAFSNFEPSTWNFLDDKDRVLWTQRTYKNSICLTIAVIHYYLGNTHRSRKWLQDELNDCGWIHMPNGTLELLDMNSYEDFFKAVYNDNGVAYKQLEESINHNYDLAHPSEEYNCFDSFY